MRVTEIPATKDPWGREISTTKKVAVYARVSTNHEDQLKSLERQKKALSKLVDAKSDWKLVKVYSDSGRSGTDIIHRKVFNEMLEDAKNGLVDLIVVKSISRFARNTIDAIRTCRDLKDIGVEVYFESQNISSFSGDGELLFSIYSSMAQEESHSMSENIKWGIKRRMERGDYAFPYKNFLGYKKGSDGSPEIVEEEARIVRKIYKFFLRGMSMNAIAKVLTEACIPSPGKGKRWYIDTIKSILTNEKYKGDVLPQKTYTPNYLTHKKVSATGKIRQYYIANSHPAIISPEIFDTVQEEIKRREELGNLSFYDGSGISLKSYPSPIE